MLDLTFFRVHELQLVEWERLYVPLNVAGELEKMREWLKANPRRRKKNYQRFVINWLNREHAKVQRAQLEARLYASAGRAPQVLQKVCQQCGSITAVKRYPDKQNALLCDVCGW